jgi:hypothetical protein
VFRINRDAQGGSGMTQFGRALAELNIEIICANSSQAKGRVERANRTLQDRLVKELRLENVCDMDAGNAFLPGFLKRFNERFALHAAKPENLHRPLNVKADRLNASRSSWSGTSSRKVLVASTSISTSSRMAYLRSDRRVARFPTVSSARTSVSATQRSSRTNVSAMR